MKCRTLARDLRDVSALGDRGEHFASNVHYLEIPSADAPSN